MEAPLVDHLLATDEYRQPNSTPEALWAIVEADLKKAIGRKDARNALR